MTMHSLRRRWAVALAAVSCAALALTAPAGASAGAPTRAAQAAQPHVLASGLGITVGSAIGPDGGLFVADARLGRLLRIDRGTGRTRVVADGLPTQIVPGVGGPMDVAFLHGRPYVLVTLVSPDVGGNAADGIYRVDGRHHVTPVADIGAFALANPPSDTDFFVASGVQYALVAHRGSFLVSDGHHNRLYRATTHGDVSVAASFGNIVPTGLARRGHRIFMAQAGPVPHVAADGKVVRVDLGRHTTVEVASGAALAVDVATRGSRMYALSQGDLPAGGEPGTPAVPGTGALLQVRSDGTMATLAEGLDRPTSVQVVGHHAYVVTLGGQVLTVRLPR